MTKVIVIGVVFLFIFMHFVLGFAVSTVYSDNFPLHLGIGEEVITEFIIQNTNDGSIVLEVSLEEGEEIAELVFDGVLEMSSGEIVEIPVRVFSSEGVVFGERMKIGANFKLISSGEGEDNIEFRTSILKSFPVVFLEDEVESSPSKGRESLFLWIVSVLSIMIVFVLIVLGYVIFRRKKEEVSDVNYAGYGNVASNV